MAIEGVLRPGLIQFRVLDMDAARSHSCGRLGLEVAHPSDDQGRVFLKGYDEFDHHSVALREADSAGIDFFAFKVDSNENLAKFRQRVEDFGLETTDVPAGENPGFGPRFSFTIPSGHRIDLYHEVELAEDHPPVNNPDIWKKEPHGMGAIRMDHCLLYGPNVDQVEKFFVEVLDFKTAERVDDPEGPMAIWLSCSNKAHDIAFVRHPEPGKLHHIAFLLETWHDVGRAADIMTRYDIPIDVGPTRHGITRGQTIYFFDPSGNRNEVYAGGYQYYPDDPTRTWEPEELGKGIFYYERKLNEAFLTVLT